MTERLYDQGCGIHLLPTRKPRDGCPACATYFEFCDREKVVQPPATRKRLAEKQAAQRKRKKGKAA